MVKEGGVSYVPSSSFSSLTRKNIVGLVLDRSMTIIPTLIIAFRDESI